MLTSSLAGLNPAAVPVLIVALRNNLRSLAANGYHEEYEATRAALALAEKQS